MRSRQFVWFFAVFAGVAATLIAIGQTVGFSADEGFHLLAAQLVRRGFHPYVDFIFPQTPLGVYLNVILMRFSAVPWRVTHFAASLETSVAVLLVGLFVLRRFPDPRWRVGGAIATLALFGLNDGTLTFAIIAQPYALCLALLTGGYCAAVWATASRSALPAALGGLCVSAAAMTSLLSAPALPVTFAWIALRNRAGNAFAKLLAFLALAVVPALPVIAIATRAPAQVWFNLFAYHLFYRRVHWTGATQQDFDALTSWLASPADLLTIVLAAVGLIFVLRIRIWRPDERDQFLLAAWVCAALSLQNACAHPTFQQYFLLDMPFLAILAVPGLYAIFAGSRAFDRPLRIAAVLTIVLAAVGARYQYDQRDDFSWYDYERIAAKLDRRVPMRAPVLADEGLYIADGRIAPVEAEFNYGQALDLGQRRNDLYKIFTQTEIDRRIAAGAYAAVETCDGDDAINEMSLNRVFKYRTDYEEQEGCVVFWGWHRR